MNTVNIELKGNLKIESKQKNGISIQFHRSDRIFSIQIIQISYK